MPDDTKHAKAGGEGDDFWAGQGFPREGRQQGAAAWALHGQQGSLAMQAGNIYQPRDIGSRLRMPRPKVHPPRTVTTLVATTGLRASPKSDVKAKYLRCGMIHMLRCGIIHTSTVSRHPVYYTHMPRTLP